MVSPYTDGSAYDLLVDSHCFPTTQDDGDDLQLSPATARAEHFSNVAAARTAAAARTDELGVHVGTCPGSLVGNVSAPLSGHCMTPPSGVGAGAETTSVSGPGVRRARAA